MTAQRPEDLPASNHYHRAQKSKLMLEYAYLWSGVSVSPAWKNEAEVMTSRIQKLLPMYSRVGRARNVPWTAIAAIDMRESGCDPMGCLANGDRWDRPTIHYPVGNGPWDSKEASCHWALDSYEKGWVVNLRKIKWNIGELFFFCESWNGFGPRMEPGCIPSDASPYVYSGAVFEGRPLYVKGKRKEARDANGKMRGYFDPEQVDRQLGVMAFLKALEGKGYQILPNG